MTQWSRNLAGASVLAAFIVAAGCGPRSANSLADGAPVRGKAGEPGDKLLKMSMDRYKALGSFSADCNWTLSAPSEPAATATRTISYQEPNRFKVVSKIEKMELTATSDGKKLVESFADTPAQSYPAPDNIASATSTLMQHPMFGGSLLYKFFMGSAGYGQLVDASKGAVTLGTEEKVGGEEAQHVKFYGTGLYGHADALIGEFSGKVFKISYDGEPLIKAAAEYSHSSKVPKTMNGVEEYSGIKFNPKLDAALFDIKTATKGKTVADSIAPQSEADMDKPPVPLGSAAPEFSVNPVSGGAAVSLKSLRGKPVMIDFWATWCGPCKESLPHTEDIYKKFGASGLQVMTVSDEDAKTIQDFVKENRYTFPTFMDTGDKAQKAYGIQGIPTIAIIDKDGKLQSFMVGLRPEDDVIASLKKIGVG